MIVAAVPVKDLVNAKQRLLGALDGPARSELARTMLRDVLRALTAARLDAVWVVSRDAEVAAIARAFGAAVLDEETNRGHTAAVASAQAEAARAGAHAFLTVPGDVPCVTAAEIDRLVTAAGDTTPSVAFAPSHSGLGTNGAVLRPPGVMPLTFGEPSFENHLAAARQRGLVPRVLRLPGLGRDIDDPDDLRALVAGGGTTESGRLVAGWQLSGRVCLEAAVRAPAS